MSFLLKALSGIPFFSRAVSAIKAAAPKIYSFLKGVRSVPGGKYAMDYLVNTAIDKSFDGVKRFANSTLIRRRAPIISDFVSNSADALRDRLKQGYDKMINGDGGGGGGGGQMSIERPENLMAG